MNASDSPQASDHESLSSTNLLVLLFRWRKPILLVTFAAAVLSAGVSLMMKEKFKSMVIMFATQQHSFGEQLLETVKKEDVLAYGEEEDAERLMQILNSDQIRNKIIENFDLWTVYDIPRDSKGARSKIGRQYNENVEARITRFGSIEVSVLDEKPERARDMANQIAAYADSVSNSIRNVRAREAFQFAHESLRSLETELKILEDSMSVLQQLGVYNYDDQVAALTEQYGTAIATGHPDRAQKIKENLEFLSRYGTLHKKLESAIEGAYEKLGVLRKRYDLIRIDIESNLPAKFIVDEATAADKKSYPIRWLIVAMSTASAFVFTVIFLLIADTFRQLVAQGKI
jgi:capsular polysaccharide biosynthesis protein